MEALDHANQQHFDSDAERCKQVGPSKEFSQVHVCHEHARYDRGPDNPERLVYRRQCEHLNALGSV